MLGYVNKNVEVAGFASVGSHFAFASEPKLITLIYAHGDFHAYLSALLN
jgi:hypothetical protein